MCSFRVALICSIALLSCDAIIELGLSLSTLLRLRQAPNVFTFLYVDKPHFLNPVPLNINDTAIESAVGASVLAVALIGLVGIGAVFLSGRRNFSASRGHKIMYYLWVLGCLASTLVTLGAIIASAVIDAKYAGGSITGGTAALLDQLLALAPVDHVNLYFNDPMPQPYPYDFWTTENWYSALLDFAPTHNLSDQGFISDELAIYRGMRWNLIPMLVLSFFVIVFGVAEEWSARKTDRANRASRYDYENKNHNVA